jgi:hypothetical protein
MLPTATDTDRDLDNALAAWTQWMRSGSVARGFPRRTPGIKWSPGQDFEQLAGAADVTLARAVDAVVDDMPARLRSALSVRHLACRWYGPADDLPYALCEAREALGEALRRRGVL